MKKQILVSYLSLLLKNVFHVEKIPFYSYIITYVNLQFNNNINKQ